MLKLHKNFQCEVRFRSGMFSFLQWIFDFILMSLLRCSFFKSFQDDAIRFIFPKTKHNPGSLFPYPLQNPIENSMNQSQLRKSQMPKEAVAPTVWRNPIILTERPWPNVSSLMDSPIGCCWAHTHLGWTSNVVVARGCKFKSRRREQPFNRVGWFIIKFIHRFAREVNLCAGSFHRNRSPNWHK